MRARSSSPSSAADTRERILQAAEALLRRHGPAKTNVVDVARSLGMSHANVYRHFSNKAALMDALVERWLRRDADRLGRIASSDKPADERLTEWMLTFIRAKRAKVLEDPEMFDAYHAAAEARREVAAAHINVSRAAFTGIIRDGIDAGIFSVSNEKAAAEAVFSAMTRFFHPHLLRQPGKPPSEAEARRVLALLVAGLKAGAL